MQKNNFFLLLFIILIGFSLRVYKLTESPAGLYIDETSIGYNAYSLLKTGRDEHGKPWPIFFEAFGEWKLPVYIYAVYLTQLILGPTDASVRLPAVVFGTLSIPLMFFLTREVIKKEKNQRVKSFTPYISGLLLAVSPWHFQFTHAGFEASSGIFFLLGGLFMFLYAASHNRFWAQIVGYISFVFALYSYNSARIVVPVIAGLLFIFYFRRFKFWQWLVVFLISTFLMIPALRFFISPVGLVRAQQVSLFYAITQDPWQQFLLNFWQNISPITLFIKGEPTIAHLTPHRMSLLYAFELPFFIVGLITLLKRKKKEFFVILVLLVVGFVPPSITTLNPHALRASLVIPATVFVSAFGAGIFFDFIWNFRLRNLLIGGYILLLGISIYNFLETYHNRYARDSGPDWQADIRIASREILKQPEYQNIYIDTFGPARIAFSWYLKIEPELYQKNITNNHVGKYYFEVNSPDSVMTNSSNLFVSRTLSTNHGRVIKVVNYPNGLPAFYLFDFSEL